MPQLKSGRHVAYSVLPYLDALAAEQDEAKYFAILAMRLYASTKEELQNHVVIVYFEDGAGTPPDAPYYHSAYSVGDVLGGRSDWSADEVEEFREFVDHEPRFATWLEARFTEIDDLIKENPVWGSSLLAQGCEDSDMAMVKRAIIEKSVLASNAMAQLRGQAYRQTDEMTQESDVSEPYPEVPVIEDPALPAELRDLILRMAQQDDVHSVSCQFRDVALWEGLLTEQVKRARATGQKPRQAFFLCGPDSQIPGVTIPLAGQDTVEQKLGGEIHIPYEGVCGADLYVYPSWRKIYPQAWKKEGATLDSATAMKPCNYLLIEKDLGEPGCATRVGPIAGTWWLYTSKDPYKPCSPFHGRG